MKKDFIVRRSITMVEGKPHVETYSEQELVRCKDCKKRYTVHCIQEEVGNINNQDDWYCADGERKS